MKFIKNEHKEYFEETVKFLDELDKLFHSKGAGHLFTEKELRKLQYAAEVDLINEYAYPTMKPTIERIKEFTEKMILSETPPVDVIISQLISNKTFRRAKNKGNKQDRGSVEILKDNIKEFLENPTVLPKSVIKKKDPVKPGANQTRLKTPRVFTLKDKDELVRPNQMTWESLCELENSYRVLIKTNIEQKIDNQNPTENYDDRKHVAVWEELEAYKKSEVVLKKDDDRIREKSKTLTERFGSYINKKATPLDAEVEHRTNIRQLTALKGNVKKAVRKQEQIKNQLAEQGITLKERLVPTTEIKPDKGRNK